MARELESAGWVRDVTDRVLAQAFEPATFARGKQYAASGAVGSLVAGNQGRLLLASVRGSTGRGDYQTLVWAPEPGAGRTLTSRCTCPMAAGCKHVVAVLVTARQRLAAATASAVPGWEQALAPLVQQATTRPPPEALPLAVELSLTPSRRLRGGDAGPSVVLRPMRQGRGKPWVRTGASWSEITSPYSAVPLRPDQKGLLAEVFRLQQPAIRSYYAVTATDVYLDDLGPLVWPLLHRCHRAGIVLLAGDGLAEVALGEGGAEVAADVRRQDSGDLLVRAVLTPQPVPEGGRVLLLGRPAHGVGVIGPERDLTLWPLAASPPEGLGDLLGADSGLRVPAKDVPRFLALYYPVLARRLPVTSSDGSIDLPTDVRPVLTLDVTYAAGHEARLQWGFAYPVPGAPQPARVPLFPQPGDPPRDEAAEQALLESLPELGILPGVLHRPRGGPCTPLPVSTLRGLATATFTTEVLPALQDRDDVEVRVHGSPADYAEAQDAPVVSLSTRQTDGEGSDWFDLRVSVSVDGQEVPFEPLFAALARGEEVLLLESGTWFSLRRPELDALRRLIEEARELVDEETEGLRLSRYQASLWEELVALGVVEEQSAAWESSVGALLGLAKAPPPDPPEGLLATLRPYQLEGYRWLSTLWDARLGGVLADDMGLGKTLQTLAMAARAHQRGELTDPLLVVAPASVVATWAQEAGRFCPDLDVRVVTATRARRGTDLAGTVRGAHVVVTSYTLLRLEDSAYRALRWSGLVLDEAQFVKNHRSRTYQAARRLGARFTLAITGTPLENSLMDLWSLVSLSAPGLFPRPELFAERYRKPIESGAAPEQLAVLRRRVRPFLLRRTKEDVAPELPPKQEQVLSIALTPAHRKIYAQHLQRERQRVLGMLDDLQRNRMAIFRALTKLRQLSLDPSLVDSSYAGRGASAKVTALLDHLQEVAAEGHRALVFSSFTGFLALVRAELDAAGMPYSYLDGRTRDRPARIARFRQGTDPVFLISLKAGGFGLTLTEADYVFVLDPWWNPAAEAQAVDRTHRIGQDKPVVVYRMVSQDTIEEKVVALQQRKRDLFARVVGDGDFASGAISPGEIRELLSG